MEVILYMAQSVNGIVSKENDDVPWHDIWPTYYHEIKKAGNIIVGKRTYEIMKKVGEFKKCGDPLTVVLSKTHYVSTNQNVIFVKSPKKALEILRSKGFRKIIVGGGSKTNYSFLKSGLIDKMYIDIEPIIFAKGIAFLPPHAFESKLKLLRIKRLSKNTIQLHYKVIK